MHFGIINIAYKFLLSLNKFKILCAFISPSADFYAQYKKLLPLIPFELRFKMVETAIEKYKSERLWKEVKNNLLIFLM